MTTSQFINYGVYFPIQVWKNKDGKKYRFQQPKIFSTSTTYEFYDHFIDSEKDVPVDDYVKVKDEYFLDRVVWVINPRYAQNVTRGFTWLYIFHEPKYPYNSVGIFSILNVPFKISLNTLYDGVSFVAYQYSIPGTSLMCFIRNRFRKIKNVAIVNTSQDIMHLEDEETDLDEDDKKYKTYPNFLPFPQNRDVPFYKIKIPDRYVFAYVFNEKPQSIYWRANSENICIPSNNPKDYYTLLDCVYNNVDKLAIRNVYTHTNNEPLQTLLQPPPPKSKAPYIFVILLCGTLLCMIMIAVIAIYKKKGLWRVTDAS